MNCGVRIRGLGFHLPGRPIALVDVDMPADLRERLKDTGQEFTYRADVDSTALTIAAAEQAMAAARTEPKDIGLVISAPTLLTSYGLEIPAVAVRAVLGLRKAECLNVFQGCVGFLAALRLAAQFIRAEPDRGRVLVVTACRASSLVDNFSHGPFFWADAAAAAVVTAGGDEGLYVESYAEKSSDMDWGAMRLRHGDGPDFRSCNPEDDLRITVDFPDPRAQADYIAGEQERCGALIDSLLAAGGLSESDIEAVFIPSIGRNRVPLLFEARPELQDKIETDFRYAHMGGVDVMFFLNQHLKKTRPVGEKWYLALTPAFTAQWGGILIRHK